MLNVNTARRSETGYKISDRIILAFDRGYCRANGAQEMDLSEIGYLNNLEWVL
jgi:hypothetical protein